MDSEFYHKKVFELVNDKNTYQELNGNIDKKINKKITNQKGNRLLNKIQVQNQPIIWITQG